MTPESDLKTALGLSDEQMRAAREKLPGAWKLADHGRIEWTDAGLDTLLDLLAEKKEAAPVALTVIRIPVNKRAVFASDGTAERLVLNVRNNTLLSPRQLIMATQQPDGQWHWHGPHPTRKGQTLVRTQKSL
jgi:hypothetical protein